MAGTVWPTLTANTKAKASDVENKFDWVEQDIVPMTGGTKTDATYDLGTSSFRWRDIRYSRQLIGPDGSSATPAISSNSATNRGLYFGTNSMHVSVAGSEVARWSSTSYLVSDGTTTSAGIGFINDPDMGRILDSTGTMSDIASGTAAQTFNPGGEITRPLQPCFLATWNVTSTTLNVNGSDETLTASWTESFDQGADFSTGVFTAPVTGKYAFYFTTNYDVTDPLSFNHWNLVTTNDRITVRGSAGGTTTTIEAHNEHTTIATVVSLTAGDTAYIAHRGTKGTTTAALVLRGFENSANGGGIATTFSGYLVA